MRKVTMIKALVLISMLIGYAISPLININLNFYEGVNEEINSDREKLKNSVISGTIHIDNNWTAAKAAGICIGSGTYSDPYIIKDLVIDGGYWDSCILIENSDVYFRIENCLLNNSGDSCYEAGIELSQVNNSQIINNTFCSNNVGISLVNSNNNTISGNNLLTNRRGICLEDSNDNIISRNNFSYKFELRFYGIFIIEYIIGMCINGNNNSIFENLMNDCGLYLSGSFEELSSHHIDTTNLVNGKPLYYYINELNLGAQNFINAGQVILVGCNNSLISNLNVSCGSGISLFHCVKSNISENSASYTSWYGIYIDGGSHNVISGNIVNDNRDYAAGIYLINSGNNIISGNTIYNNTYGLELYNSDCNKISGNTATNNRDYGIRLVNCDNNTISENDIYENHIGISLGSSNNSVISKNSVNNGFVGITLGESHYDNISENMIANNSNMGLSVGNSNYNNMVNNSIDSQSYGIHLSNSKYNMISRNTISNNVLDGISFYILGYKGPILSKCDYNTITENIINNNRIGINFYGGDYNLISRNTINNNDYGIYLYKSCYNDITENTFIDNNDDIYNSDGCGVQTIPFELIILISSISGGVVIAIVVTVLLIRRKRRNLT